MRALLVVAVVALAVAGCSSPQKSPETGMSLSEAFCSDLKAGNSPLQIWGAASGSKSPKEMADSTYGYVAVSCPDELKTNQELRTYLKGWNINPDA